MENDWTGNDWSRNQSENNFGLKKKYRTSPSSHTLLPYIHSFPISLYVHIYSAIKFVTNNPVMQSAVGDNWCVVTNNGTDQPGCLKLSKQFAVDYYSRIILLYRVIFTNIQSNLIYIYIYLENRINVNPPRRQNEGNRLVVGRTRERERKNNINIQDPITAVSHPHQERGGRV